MTHPAMDDRLVWFKDAVVPLSKAKVSALSATAQFGLNVFEGVRGYWNEDASDIFLVAVDRHLRRLRESARIMGLNIAPSDETTLEAMRAVVEASRLYEDISLRVICMADSVGTWSDPMSTELLIAPIPAHRVQAETGWALKATVSSWRRIADDSMPPRVKTGANYVSGRYAMLDARNAGFDVPILLSATGKVSEAPGSSLALVRDEAIVFPPLSSGVLEGITRDILISLAGQQGIHHEVREIDRTELLIADELFVCGSAAEVRAIGSVDRLSVGTGGFGSITASLLKTYHATVDGRHPSSHVPITAIYGSAQ